MVTVFWLMVDSSRKGGMWEMGEDIYQRNHQFDNEVLIEDSLGLVSV